MNDSVENKSWWNKNWKWIIPVFGIFLISIITISTTDIGKNTFDIVKAYADPNLVETALDKAQDNDEVKELLGTLEQVDKMAKLEGSVKYSNNDTSVDISVRVKGSKGKGRMRIIAERNGETWEYKKIVIGIKKLKKTIEIIGETD
jgi:hypothetical protein